MITGRALPLVLLASAAMAATVTVQPGDPLQENLNSLSPGDTLYLSPGTYTLPENTPFLFCGPATAGITITSHPENRAVLHGQGLERPVIVASGPHNSPLLLENLVITGGNSTGSGYFNGGGLSLQEASALVSNCLITENTAYIGGGVGAEGGTVVLQYSTLSLNEALVTGGGCDIYACDFTGFMLRFISNTSSDDGGGLNSYQSSIYLGSSLFTGNYSGDDGGGIAVLQGVSLLEFLTVHDNGAFDDGGGLRIHTIDSFNLRSSIVTSNQGKGGINVISSIKPEVSHVCCWNNEQAQYQGMEDPTGTSGNISEDPLYADPFLNLSQTEAGQPWNSPAVDAGHGPAWETAAAGFSTRTDSLPDTGTADMGYHHINFQQTGIEPETSSTDNGVSVSPSPVRTSSVLSISAPEGDTVILEFFDLTGRRLERFTAEYDTGGIQIDRGRFPAGLIIVRALWQTGGASGRFVVLP